VVACAFGAGVTHQNRTMNWKTPARLSVLTLAAGSLSSCVFISKVYDEPKLPMSFDSAKAAQTFYDRTYVPETPGRNMGSFGIGYTLPKITRRDGPQLRFNKAARMADTDGDQYITTDEAEAYAEGDR
jgi:hypothetical protein